MSESMNGSKELTDFQLAAELEKFGESITLPIRCCKKRVILRKKLNHYRARLRQSQTLEEQQKTDFQQDERYIEPMDH